MSKKIKLILILFFLCNSSVLYSADLSFETATTFKYLNKLRQQTGLVPFKYNKNLEKSALNHAKYLTSNNQIGHLEQPGLPAFTGLYPKERAIFSGYDSKSISENLSLGQGNGIESINSLMAAIYHRFGFLDFYKNEIGIGVIKGEFGKQFVYTMGNEQLDKFCEYPRVVNDSEFYKNACRHQKKVSKKEYDLIEKGILKNNSPFVFWPPEDSDFINPAFYEEAPDPLPDLKISGYPISFQLNPNNFNKFELIYFRLFNQKTKKQIKETILITPKNDPNKKLKYYQFALFPVKRLKWGERYKARIKFKANGKIFKKKWSFSVKKLNAELIKISGLNEKIILKPEKKYAIFIPSRKNIPYIEELKWQSKVNVKSMVKWGDKNTIIVSFIGKICDRIDFYLNFNRTFQVILGDSSTLKESYLINSSTESCDKTKIK